MLAIVIITMLKRLLFLLGTVTLLLFSADNLFGQEIKQPFANGDFGEKLKDISHVVIKVDKKMYDFEMDTLGVGFRTILQIEPDWIKSIDVLKNKELEGMTKTYLILNLKRGKLKKLPVEMRSKFY